VAGADKVRRRILSGWYGGPSFDPRPSGVGPRAAASPYSGPAVRSAYFQALERINLGLKLSFE
jgi:hypothetical protein